MDEWRVWNKSIKINEERNKFGLNKIFCNSLSQHETENPQKFNAARKTFLAWLWKVSFSIISENEMLEKREFAYSSQFFLGFGHPIDDWNIVNDVFEIEGRGFSNAVESFIHEVADLQN